MPSKKKNPQDLTLRNLKAVKKRLARVERILETVIAWQDDWSVANRQSLILKLHPTTKRGRK